LLKEIVIAVQSYFKAHQFIIQNRLWKWILIPGIIYALLFAGSMYFFGSSATGVIEYLTEFSGIRNWVQKFENSWLGFFFTLAGIIFWIILMFFYFSLFKYIWLILGSPIFAYLSEKTSSIIEGRDYPFSMKQLLADILRGIRLALRNTLWQTVYTLSILILSFIPVIGWATPILALFVECYYYGFSMLDYSCERKQMNVSKSIEYVGKHKGLAIGNGLVFYLMHGIIIIGWVLAPAYAVIAATISMHEQKSS
jgi:CysZ protein